MIITREREETIAKSEFPAAILHRDEAALH